LKAKIDSQPRLVFFEEPARIFDVPGSLGANDLG
jgi:hypothetical protein